MGLRKTVKAVADDLKSRESKEYGVFSLAGQSFVLGIHRYREERFGDPAYIGPAPPANTSQERQNTEEFIEAIRYVRKALGYEGHRTTRMILGDLPDRDYLAELEGAKIKPASLGNCALIFLQNSADGTLGAYERLGKLLVSDQFIGQLGQGRTADTFYNALLKSCGIEIEIPKPKKRRERTHNWRPESRKRRIPDLPDLY